MKTEKVINFIRNFLAFIVLCGGWFLVFDFFFNRIGEGMRIVDWLYLLLGIFFIMQGGLFFYSIFKKRKEEKYKNKDL